MGLIQFIHDHMIFTISLSAWRQGDDWVGFYEDHAGHLQTIARRSLYGQIAEGVINGTRIA